jgi:hypothetical protein
MSGLKSFIIDPEHGLKYHFAKVSDLVSKDREQDSEKGPVLKVVTSKYARVTQPSQVKFQTPVLVEGPVLQDPHSNKDIPTLHKRSRSNTWHT